MCEDDFDGDFIKDFKDDCPTNKNLTDFDFRTLVLIPLDPIGVSQMDPRWTIRNNVSISSSSFIECYSSI